MGLDGVGGLVAKLCLTLAIPWTVARQAPLSMGFSRQEYWNGLPFPSPGDIPNPGIKSRSPTLQADSLLTELWGKLFIFLCAPFFWGGGKNTGMGCHSLLQEIFLTQELNPGLLHCRQMLYRLSHQGSQDGISFKADNTIILGWPKSLFRFFIASCVKIQTNFWPTH